jgi:hypothetical protein
MGQYHYLANLDTKEFVMPSGAKQYEHTFYNGDLAHAMYLLTMTSPYRGGGDWAETTVSGRWAGDRVVILGDYTVDEDLPDYPYAGMAFNSIIKNGTNITEMVNEALEKVLEKI